MLYLSVFEIFEMFSYVMIHTFMLVQKIRQLIQDPDLKYNLNF